MALKFITAEEAASYVHNDDNVGFSGFTPAGCPKVVPGAIARKAEEEHKKGNPFKIGMFTGASTGDKLMVSWHVRTPSSSVRPINPARTYVQRSMRVKHPISICTSLSWLKICVMAS